MTPINQPMLYKYRIIKENFVNGQRGKRSRTISRTTPLQVNGLYFQLGNGLNGSWRVLELVSAEPITD